MSDPRCLTLVMFDHDRFFVEGVLRFLQSQYPHTVRRLSTRPVKKVDLLLTGLDAVSLCASLQFGRMMTAESQLVVVHHSFEESCRGLPPGLQRYPTRHLHPRPSLEQLGKVFKQLIPDKNRLITLIDPRAVKEDVLTPREKMLLAHLRSSLTPRQIAASMALHPKTISTYKRSVMLKLGMQKNLELYHWLFYSSLSEGERS